MASIKLIAVIEFGYVKLACPELVISKQTEKLFLID